MGKDVNITCRVSIEKDEIEALRWTRIVDAGEPEGEMIYSWPMLDEPVKPDKYQVTRNGDNFDLRILNLDFYDGGFYHCQLVLAAKIVGADLVVLSEYIKPETLGLVHQKTLSASSLPSCAPVVSPLNSRFPVLTVFTWSCTIFFLWF